MAAPGTLGVLGSHPGFGAGVTIAGLVGPYAAVVAALNWFVLPGVQIPSWSVVYAAGGGLVGAGVACVLVAYWQLLRAQARGELCRQGLFGLVRHPMYAGWIWLIVPGSALLLRLPLVLSVSPVMAAVTLWSLPAEEEELHTTFGPAYDRYRDSVNALVPTF